MRSTIALTILILSGSSAAAQCYADYKAKQEGPLRLHYGVAELRGACAPGPAAEEIRDRISRNGWELVNVLGVFGPEGLDERRESAGQFFLRF